MLKRHEHNGLVWIDMEAPTRDEIVRTAAEFSVDASVAEELLVPSAKPRAEHLGDYIYAIMHFPALRHSHKTRAQEIDFIVGKRFIITAHYDTIDPLHKFSKLFEVSAALDEHGSGAHAGIVFAAMLKRLYRAVEHELESVKKEMQAIEDHIFSGHEERMVRSISLASRDLLNLRQTIEPHRDMLQEFDVAGASFFGDEFRPHLKVLSNEYYRVHNHITRSTESLRELRQTNDSLLETKQNETMRVLTVMSVYTFPLALLVAIFGIDTLDNPIREIHHGFVVTLAANILVWLVMFVYFKRKRWL